MKTRTRKTLLLILLMLGLYSPNVFPTKKAGKDKVALDGSWGKNDRNTASAVPISAFITDNILSIYNTSIDSDINILIINEYGETIWDCMIPKIDTKYITIPIDDTYPGEYTLILIGSEYNYLSGKFHK